jgi:hypothetical protein
MKIGIIDLLEAKQEISRRWFSKPGRVGRMAASNRWAIRATSVARAGQQGIHGIGVGPKMVAGKKTHVTSVRVYVLQKLPLATLTKQNILPKSIAGIPLDVVECLPPRLQTRRRAVQQNRHRPLVAGISIGHRDITAGTLGYFARFVKASNDEVLILSNNHVLANVNKARRNDPIYQPGPFDGGTRRDSVARLARYVRMATDGRTANRVDAAVATVRNIPHQTRLLSLGVAKGVVRARLGTKVQKEGRTTGVTQGEVDDISVDTAVGMDDFDPRIVAVFENQIRIMASAPSRIFSAGGDSGSLIITRPRKKAVALLFAGPQDNSYTLANPIQAVLEELEISLL